MMGSEDNKKIGTWFWDAEGLPAFRYEGRLPYEEKYDDGRKIELPDDPWVLLGNHQITVITYMSGEFELLSGQRSWARLNQRKDRDLKYKAPWGRLNGEKNYNCGANRYKISIDDRE